MTNIQPGLKDDTVNHLRQNSNTTSVGARWTPVVGDEATKLLDQLGLPATTATSVLDEAMTVLGHCAPPTLNQHSSRTGLVVGHVQSGKTMSFTALAALAHDNGFRLIIVCTGLTTHLFAQSSDRLRRDLQIDDRRDRRWVVLANPRYQPQNVQRLQKALRVRDPDSGRKRQAALITVMKNGAHLDNLSRLLGSLDLNDVPTLVIDDEADQASLNNDVKKDTESATYRRILGIRLRLPSHTFLQFTATPQAILLINLIDQLSPEFAVLLTPGPTYTGGQEFFVDGYRELLRNIPPSEIPEPKRPLHEPPDSLLEAMRIFYLGVSAGLASDEEGNRSMMVHPSSRTLQHAHYDIWVRAISETWLSTLSTDPANPDRQDLLAAFAASHADLVSTVADLPPLETLKPFLVEALSDTIITQVNSVQRPTPRPDWLQDYGNIVVGGDVLSRGYTIEGLTVSYVPRSLGTKQADTIQQRARWFGYKANYLGYCRVYLPSDARQAYLDYADHENLLREQLSDHASSGQSLREWRRAFFLDCALKPTRGSVIAHDVFTGVFSNNWYWPRAPHQPSFAVAENRGVVEQLQFRLHGVLRSDDGHPSRTEDQHHLVADEVPLSWLYESVLTRFHFTRPADAAQLNGLLLQIGNYLMEDAEASCCVYIMTSGRLRRRTVRGDVLPVLFQGKDFDTSTNPPTLRYPGDDLIRDELRLTLQVHNLHVTSEREVIATNVPEIAVWVPKAMAKSWASQAQGDS